MDKLKYFSYSEFDSPLEKGSGQKMQLEFLEKLDKARELAGIPFKITSGFRVPADIDRLKKKGYKVAKHSPHLGGWAADIATLDSVSRFIILKALLDVGFNRIGMGSTFIHVDCDPTKAPFVIWGYY